MSILNKKPPLNYQFAPFLQRLIAVNLLKYANFSIGRLKHRIQMGGFH